MVVWRFMHHKIPTDDNYAIRGFSLPSMCSLCQSNSETMDHLFFSCNFALAVLKASIVSIFYQVWRARNKVRHESSKTSWNSCVASIAAQVKLDGNLSSRKCNNNISNFVMLKRFDVNLNPSKTIDSFDVLWTPPLQTWIKCNIDGEAKGTPWKAVCGGIFRDCHANHVLSFSMFLGNEPPANAELLAVMVAMEKAMELELIRFWLESDCYIVVNAFYNHALVLWNLRSRWLVCWAYMMNIDFRITHGGQFLCGYFRWHWFRL
ncbi:uncharacterized protein LOC131633606 [Vicia villosa]|uniref:uncharacterized protein LOC131633606 n=1 Tax=Vicia villosa TaxID=3911 RepID=UPI00273C3B91|nr:uncharacterized protein LOC131633606 [Vicia villosa]